MFVHHIALRSFEPERLVNFYQQVLGLRLLHQSEQRAWWLSLGDDRDKEQIPNAVLMIERAEAGEPQPDPRSMDLLAFTVDSKKRAQLLKQLEAYDVVLEEQGVNTSYFRDPEGRRLGISQFDFSEFLA